MRQLRDRPGQFHARGTAADNDERQQFGMVLGGEGPLAGLERSQDLAAELNRVGEGFQARGIRCVLVVTEVAVLNSGRQYEVVVGQGERNPVHEAHPFRDIHSRDGALDHGGVGLPAQHVADRCPDVLGGEDRGGHLVEERLEDVVVGLVDQEHAGLTLPQGAGRRETAEAPAHDNDSRVACRDRRNGFHLLILRLCLSMPEFLTSPSCLTRRFRRTRAAGAGR